MSHVVSTGSERTVDLRRRNFDREILTDPCETPVTRAQVSSLTILRVFQMYQDPEKDTKDEKTVLGLPIFPRECSIIFVEREVQVNFFYPKI